MSGFTIEEPEGNEEQERRYDEMDEMTSFAQCKNCNALTDNPVIEHGNSFCGTECAAEWWIREKADKGE